LGDEWRGIQSVEDEIGDGALFDHAEFLRPPEGFRATGRGGLKRLARMDPLRMRSP
jgi:hypothetical protein